MSVLRLATRAQCDFSVGIESYTAALEASGAAAEGSLRRYDFCKRFVCSLFGLVYWERFDYFFVVYYEVVFLMSLSLINQYSICMGLSCDLCKPWRPRPLQTSRLHDWRNVQTGPTIALRR